MGGILSRISVESSLVTILRFSTHARQAYRKLYRSDRRLFERLDRSLDRLAEHPELGKPLVGPLSGHRSLRVGNLRVIYRVSSKESEIQVLEISSRGRAYRDRL